MGKCGGGLESENTLIPFSEGTSIPRFLVLVCTSGTFGRNKLQRSLAFLSAMKGS
jgi:hypothetical protein